MTSATQTPVVNGESNLDIEPAVVLTNETLTLLDAQFPDAETFGMPDDALDSDTDQK